MVQVRGWGREKGKRSSDWEKGSECRGKQVGVPEPPALSERSRDAVEQEQRRRERCTWKSAWKVYEGLEFPTRGQGFSHFGSQSLSPALLSLWRWGMSREGGSELTGARPPRLYLALCFGRKSVPGTWLLPMATWEKSSTGEDKKRPPAEEHFVSICLLPRHRRACGKMWRNSWPPLNPFPHFLRQTRVSPHRQVKWRSSDLVSGDLNSGPHSVTSGWRQQVL